MRRGWVGCYKGHYASNNTDRPGRARPTPRHGGAAVRFRAKLAGQPDPAGEATARVLGGYRRTAVASLVYYARHVEKNSVLSKRIEAFLEQAFQEWEAMRPSTD